MRNKHRQDTVFVLVLIAIANIVLGTLALWVWSQGLTSVWFVVGFYGAALLTILAALSIATGEVDATHPRRRRDD